MAQDIGNSNLLEVWSSSGQIVEPDISKIEEGWQLGEQPPHEFMNWLQNTFGEKLNHVLSNGIAQWNSETAYNAGAMVLRGGTAWSALQPNANSEPVEANTNWSEIVRLSDARKTNDLTVTVGAGGDFATINAALTHLSGFYPEYKNTGVTATIELQAGFVMAEQVLVRAVDMGWITITGVDAETVIDHTALTIDFTTDDYGFVSRPAFGVSRGGTLPRIAQLFSMSAGWLGAELKSGVMAVGGGSSAEVASECGVKNVGNVGIFATRNSTINAQNANASEAGAVGIFAEQGSTINAQNANASGAGSIGIYATLGSTINANGANASGAGDNGIHAAQGSTINALGANASGAGDRGIHATQGGTINANGANASGAGNNGIFATQSSTINAQGANASGAGNIGILATLGSTINAQSADASGAGVHGILVDQGGTINARGAIIQNQTTGTAAVRVSDGSHIEASGINTTGTTVTILSQAANTLTGNGIIYQ